MVAREWRERIEKMLKEALDDPESPKRKTLKRKQAYCRWNEEVATQQIIGAECKIVTEAIKTKR